MWFMDKLQHQLMFILFPQITVFKHVLTILTGARFVHQQQCHRAIWNFVLSWVLHFLETFTLPETNIAPESRVSQKESSFPTTII